MPESKFSDMLKNQVELAWQYIEKAKPLITYTKLVPVQEDQIAQYEQKQNKIVPPDYRYWLTTHGSGRIEFLEGDLKIVSIYEFLQSDDRTVSKDDPQGCSKRVYIGYAGAPVTLALDSTIIDEHGCAPVIQTHCYENTVETVLASSWPMYVVKRILEIASSINNRVPNNSFTDEQNKAINELANQDFQLIDDALGRASERADAHNNTKADDTDIVNNNTEMLDSMLDFLEEGIKARASRKLIPRLMSGLTALFSKDDAFTTTVAQLEEQIEKGYASLDDNLFFHNKIEPRHAKGVKAILGHERRELRKLAEDGWLRINPGEAEKQAERSWDWLKCAEDWMVVDKSRKESIRCLREAEKHAENFTAWNACVDFWKDNIRNNDEARRCLLIAEGNIENTDRNEVLNYITVAQHWIYLNDRERAKSILNRAETVSDPSVKDMVWLSEKWRENFNDIESAKRCLLRAESLVSDRNQYDLSDILIEWEEINDKDELQRFKSENRNYLNR